MSSFCGQLGAQLSAGGWVTKKADIGVSSQRSETKERLGNQMHSPSPDSHRCSKVRKVTHIYFPFKLKFSPAQKKRREMGTPAKIHQISKT